MLLEKENVNKVQRRRNEFGTPPTTYVTITQLRYKFEVDATVQNLDKEFCENLTVQLTMEVLR
jgi:hypothetical protein